MLVETIASHISSYPCKQKISHAQFLETYSDLVISSNIHSLPNTGFIFDNQMKQWNFKKHGCGYEFSHDGVIIDINDYFLSHGDIFSAHRLFFYLESINFKFDENDKDDEEKAIKAALSDLQSKGKIVKTLSYGHYKLRQN